MCSAEESSLSSTTSRSWTEVKNIKVRSSKDKVCVGYAYKLWQLMRVIFVERVLFCCFLWLLFYCCCCYYYIIVTLIVVVSISLKVFNCSWKCIYCVCSELVEKIGLRMREQVYAWYPPASDVYKSYGESELDSYSKSTLSSLFHTDMRCTVRATVAFHFVCGFGLEDWRGYGRAKD